MNLFDKFLEVFKVFEEENVEYILIGGFAIILHGFPRLTQDIDILIRITDLNLEKLIKALYKVFADSEVNQITIKDLEDHAVVRYRSPDGIQIDLVAGIGNRKKYEDLNYENIKIEGVSVRTATPESLKFLKKDSLRPEDQQDLNFLEELIKKRTNRCR